MGGNRGLRPWVWRHERRAAVRLLAACLVLAAAAPALAVTEMAGLRTVHVIYPMHAASLRLGAGRYSLDQDPDATGFPVSAAALSIDGPGGGHARRVRISFTAYDLSPADLGGVLLGVGDFVQAARFTITRPGRYQITVADPQAGGRLYISEPFSAAALRSGPWALAILAATATLTITATRLTLRYRASRNRTRFAHMRLMEPQTPADQEAHDLDAAGQEGVSLNRKPTP